MTSRLILLFLSINLTILGQGVIRIKKPVKELMVYRIEKGDSLLQWAYYYNANGLVSKYIQFSSELDSLCVEIYTYDSLNRKKTENVFIKGGPTYSCEFIHPDSNQMVTKRTLNGEETILKTIYKKKKNIEVRKYYANDKLKEIIRIKTKKKIIVRLFFSRHRFFFSRTIDYLDNNNNISHSISRGIRKNGYAIDTTFFTYNEENKVATRYHSFVERSIIRHRKSTVAISYYYKYIK